MKQKQRKCVFVPIDRFLGGGTRYLVQQPGEKDTDVSAPNNGCFLIKTVYKEERKRIQE